MATLKFENVGISAIAACVPKQVERNADLGYFMSEEDIQKAINNIGIEERRIASADVCSSDLCYQAAKQLYHCPLYLLLFLCLRPMQQLHQEPQKQNEAVQVLFR